VVQHRLSPGELSALSYRLSAVTALGFRLSAFSAIGFRLSAIHILFWGSRLLLSALIAES